MIYFASHSIIIRRLRSSGTNKSAFSATFTAYPADLQPVQVERIEMVGGRVGKTYEAWVDSTIDIKEGDQVKTLSDNKIYSVKSVSTFEGAGMLDHHYLILMSQD